MEVSVVSRTDSEHRILESVHLDKAEAEEARQGIIKRYKNAPRLCTDTETDTFTVDVWVATKVKATKDGQAPETTVLAVGSQFKWGAFWAIVFSSLGIIIYLYPVICEFFFSFLIYLITYRKPDLQNSTSFHFLQR